MAALVDRSPLVTPTLEGKRNLSLEGFRGFLALSVLVFHVYEMGANAGWYPEPRPGGTLALSGIYVVSLFFCVSGYLIVQSLLVKSNLWVFARNRVVRIYPVFLALHLIIFTFGPIYGYAWMGQLVGHPLRWFWAFVSNLLFLPGVFLLPLAQKNAWSLSYEALFYVSAGLLFFALHRRYRWLTGVLVVSCCAVIWLRPLCVFFLVGYLAYAIERRNLIHGRWIGWLAIPALIGGVYLFSINAWLCVLPVLAVFYAVVREAGVFSQLLRRPALLYLGRISFSLYLVHPFALDPIRSALLRHASSHRVLAAILFPAIGFVATLVCSSISHSLIERRLTRWILRRPENDRLQRA